jgi:hypothetical protein
VPGRAPIGLASATMSAQQTGGPHSRSGRSGDRGGSYCIGCVCAWSRRGAAAGDETDAQDLKGGWPQIRTTHAQEGQNIAFGTPAAHYTSGCEPVRSRTSFPHMQAAAPHLPRRPAAQLLPPPTVGAYVGRVAGRRVAHPTQQAAR